VKIRRRPKPRNQRMPIAFKQFRTTIYILLGLFPGIAFCRERITLSSGFSVEVDSHQRRGGTLLLTTKTGSLEFLAQDVASIEVVPGTASALSQPKSYPSPIPEQRTSDLLGNAARQQGLPVALINSVAMAESALHPQARSKKGALGLMQLMPATAKELGVAPANSEGNVNGGTRYLRQLLERYQGNAVLALAAYNAGTGTVARFGGVPPFPETQAYIKRILRLYEQKVPVLPGGRTTAIPNSHPVK
jgi:hypothetical protein